MNGKLFFKNIQNDWDCEQLHNQKIIVGKLLLEKYQLEMVTKYYRIKMVSEKFHQLSLTKIYTSPKIGHSIIVLKSIHP